MSHTLSVLFVDASVKNYEYLLAGLPPETDAYLLSPCQDGIEEITEILATQYAPGDVDAIHILSHGVPGCLKFSAGELSLSTLARHAADLAMWNVHLICLYGCNVAAGDAGEEFVEKLHRITNAEVAASSTPIGHAAKGGDWQLTVVDSGPSPNFGSSAAETISVTIGGAGTVLDTDGDGTFDHLDLDSDGDTTPDAVESQATATYINEIGGCIQ